VTTTAATPAGNYQLTLTGTSGSLTHSTSVALTVAPRPDFAVTVSPASQSVRRGGSVTYSVTVTPLGGFTGSVTLTMSSAPTGLKGTFSPAALTSGSSRLSVAGGTKLGTFTVTVTGTSGGLTHTAPVVLVVTK
jgi:hypothetical protein